MASPSRHTAIIGGGIMGATTAYYLTEQPGFDISAHKVTIIEAVGIAQAASGKAGGLVSVVEALHTEETYELAKISWKLHSDLAAKHNGAEKWWYRRVDMQQQELESTKPEKPALPPPDWDTSWLNTDQITKCSVEGTKDSAGQVGVEVILGKVNRATYAENGSFITTLQYVPRGDTSPINLAVTNVVLAAGPWSGEVFGAIKPSGISYELPVFGTRGHSIFIDTLEPLPPLAVFTEYHNGESERLEGETTKPFHLEFYPRPEYLYVCGPADNRTPLPPVDTPAVDSAFCNRMFEMCGKTSHVLANGTLRQKQSCYMPMVKLTDRSSANPVLSGPPLIGKLPFFDNLIAATGHSCWGMMFGPATGYVVAEIPFAS
ncbi:hypothetical protein UA08_09264 [Talaromyces atroroseus]|uniref:FAD dependent oxidoreductase domain-containing protein n=1 Tax=Talaromyces atroroseus TaxID=1441469 RepID=A0A1Q5Q6H8_TALAT|nr:hypothetical protein UA08_09264 [Talaromyces atroroseus]OKL55449.1 hypothetical protein UA08_09264 [Talaromyces atroroseus]